jgi:hypothetical protein
MSDWEGDHEAYQDAVEHNEVEQQELSEIEEAIAFLHRHGYDVTRTKTLEDIHPADREYSSAYYNKYGDKVTANGYDWGERMLDGDYLYALTHAAEPPDPADYDDDPDRYDYEEDEEGEGERR